MLLTKCFVFMPKLINFQIPTEQLKESFFAILSLVTRALGVLNLRIFCYGSECKQALADLGIRKNLSTISLLEKIWF